MPQDPVPGRAQRDLDRPAAAMASLGVQAVPRARSAVVEADS